MGKGLHRVFSTIVLEISQELTDFGETGLEVSHFIPEPRNFAEVIAMHPEVTCIIVHWRNFRQT